MPVPVVEMAARLGTTLPDTRDKNEQDKNLASQNIISRIYYCISSLIPIVMPLTYSDAR